jgi:hypothetical protein
MTVLRKSDTSRIIVVLPFLHCRFDMQIFTDKQAIQFRLPCF